jgi:hypothetical protein
MPSGASANRISGLEALIKAQAAKGPAPVEQWDPPYCGDIGLRIRADGVWLYRDSPIGRPALVKLFAGDDIVTAGPQHPLRFAIEPGSGGLKPYLRVRGRLEALVTRALTYDLVDLAAETEGRGLGLWSAGTFFPLPESSPSQPASDLPDSTERL